VKLKGHCGSTRHGFPAWLTIRPFSGGREREPARRLAAIVLVGDLLLASEVEGSTKGVLVTPSAKDDDRFIVMMTSFRTTIVDQDDE